MREFQNKRTWRRVGSSPIVLIGLAILVGFSFPAVWRLYQKKQIVSTERQLLLEEVERLKERQSKLAVEVQKLSTSRGVEETIRENFNVVRPGENVIYLLPPTTTAPIAVERSRSWWLELMGWLGL